MFLIFIPGIEGSGREANATIGPKRKSRRAIVTNRLGS